MEKRTSAKNGKKTSHETTQKKMSDFFQITLLEFSVSEVRQVEQ